MHLPAGEAPLHTPTLAGSAGPKTAPSSHAQQDPATDGVSAGKDCLMHDFILAAQLVTPA